MDFHTQHLIVTGDARRMKLLADNSVHLIITSPPYWQLKDYGHESQIGFHDSFEAYINNLNMAWQECVRVLHPGCRLCINIGDQFARAILYGRYKLISIQSEIIRFCETMGCDYMGTIIWQKCTTVNTTGGATIMGSFPYPRNGIVKIDYEYILLFKKPGRPPTVSAEAREQSQLTTKEWNRYFYGHWNFSGEKQDRHLAAFPEELPRRLIRMFSFVGETVFDPFAGSGTTSLAAKHTGRNSIAYELNADFLPIIRKRLAADSSSLFEQSRCEFRTQAPLTDAEVSLNRLPYLFRDPHKLDKQIDPRKLRFGSKIEAGSETGRTYRLAAVLAPNVVRLDTGIEVELAGLRPRAGNEREAMELLHRLVEGREVTLRFPMRSAVRGKRVRAYIYQGAADLNSELLASGLYIRKPTAARLQPVR
jgi:DNA modification methylase